MCNFGLKPSEKVAIFNSVLMNNLITITIIIIIIIIIYQAISPNYFKNKILKQEIESKCRLCKQHEETIDHLTSGCPILAKNEYLMRHDKVCTHLHYSICRALGIETTDKWYTHMPKPVCEEGDVTVLWNKAEKLQQIGQI